MPTSPSSVRHPTERQELHAFLRFDRYTLYASAMGRSFALYKFRDLRKGYQLAPTEFSMRVDSVEPWTFCNKVDGSTAKRDPTTGKR